MKRSMNKREFYDYIVENFSISGEACRLINNILEFADARGMSGNELYLYLTEMLDGTIGLSDAEIKKVDF